MAGMLYIVSGKKTRAEAEYLESCVDASGTPVAGERTDLWNVRDYLRGAEGLSPEDRLVFVGAADAWEAETAGGEVRLDEFGMRCVVLGRRALLTVREDPLAGRKERRAFLDRLRRSCPEIPEDEIEYIGAERKIALFDSLRAVVNPIGTVMEQQIAPPSGSNDLSGIERLQYKALALMFVKEVLPDWAAD